MTSKVTEQKLNKIHIKDRKLKKYNYLNLANSDKFDKSLAIPLISNK